MAVRAFQGVLPRVDPTAWIEESAQVIGDVWLGARSSVWFNCVVRGDVNEIRIGDDTNIQDLSCLHVLKERFALRVGNRVTVGHSVTLHGCTVEDLCLIGMGATVLDGARIGEGSIVAAGSLVAPGTVVPPGSMAVGSPARVKRPLSPTEREMLERSAESYVEYARQYQRR
jgi:gamma-carbonic anhydrase